MIGLSDAGRLARRGLLCLALGSSALGVAGALRAGADEAVAVRIDNFRFGPGVLRIKQGTDVTWENRDDIPHSIVVPGAGVRSHPLDTEGTFVYRFDKAGVYDYICGLHPFMKGQVVVSE
jgi:plastocyanin